MDSRDESTDENPFQSPIDWDPPASKKERYFSIEYEPAFGVGGCEIDPAEVRATPIVASSDELELLRDSIALEPALPHHADPHAWIRWIEEKRSHTTLGGNLAVTFLAAVISGPFAILGAMLSGRSGVGGVFYLLIAGPLVEELLKQSGMTFLLEKKPYRVFAAWQFVFVAVVAGFVFATIENLVYIHIAFPSMGVQNVAAAASFRWIFCTLLHVSCAAIASFGLIRVWRLQNQNGGPIELATAFPFFVTAMIVHGLYNFAVMFVKF